jgi:catechol 2,3-dioxygenase-like lactoylglutathione lyase family enzyme
MRLNHLDLHVPDVAATTNFFVTHLGLRLVEMRGANGLAILTDGHGLEIIVSKPIAKYGGVDQVETGRMSYHIGFILDDRAEVDAVYARIAADGAADLWHEPREIRGGWLFYCVIPGNILVEVGARPLYA